MLALVQGVAEGVGDTDGVTEEVGDSEGVPAIYTWITKTQQKSKRELTRR